MKQYRIVLKKALTPALCISMDIDLYNKHTKDCTESLVNVVFAWGCQLNSILIQSLLAESKDHTVEYGKLRFETVKNDFKIYLCNSEQKVCYAEE
jgi:hypothetical protein